MLEFFCKGAELGGLADGSVPVGPRSKAPVRGSGTKSSWSFEIKCYIWPTVKLFNVLLHKNSGFNRRGLAKNRFKRKWLHYIRPCEHCAIHRNSGNRVLINSATGVKTAKTTSLLFSNDSIRSFYRMCTSRWKLSVQVLTAIKYSSAETCIRWRATGEARSINAAKVAKLDGN